MVQDIFANSLRDRCEGYVKVRDENCYINVYEKYSENEINVKLVLEKIDPTRKILTIFLKGGNILWN